MEKILISACLLGIACRYDGESKNYDLGKIAEKYDLVPFCPEIYGGLPTPRIPSEITGDRVINKDGIDVTEQYRKGAEEALKVCKILGIKKAVLKEKSPSCGKGRVYDGSFMRNLIDGDGVTVKLLKEHGIEIFTENEINRISKEV